MKPALRARFAAAADYLAVAPRVVEVVRTLDLPAVDAQLHAPTAARREEVEALGERYGLGGSLQRLLSVLE
jgi:hypothetical protein